MVLGFLAVSSAQVELNSTELPSIYYTEPSSASPSSVTDNIYKVFTELPGGQITRGQRLLEKWKSPYVVREDLFVERGGELVIEPGVEIRFAPMIGITVRGILTAKVNTIPNF